MGESNYESNFDVRSRIFNQNSPQIYYDYSTNASLGRLGPFSDTTERGLRSHPIPVHRIEYFKDQLERLEREGKFADPHEITFEPHCPGDYSPRKVTLK